MAFIVNSDSRDGESPPSPQSPSPSTVTTATAMQLEHIRTFLEIADSGSFSRAAEALNVTQSTVSGRVKLLEDWFGRPLFVRGHAGVALTPAGQKFRRYAEGIERLWRQSQQQLALPEGYRTALALGAQVSLWERLILDWMPRMRASAPEVALQVQADYSVSLMRQLSDGVLDIGVMYQPRHAAGLVVEDLFEETLVMASPQARAVSPGWVEDYVFVDWGDTFRAEHSAAFPDLETPAVSVGLGDLGLRYILQNGGAGYFPRRMVDPLVAAGELHLVQGAPTAQRPVYLVYTADPKDADALTLALDILRDIAVDAEAK